MLTSNQLLLFFSKWEFCIQKTANAQEVKAGQANAISPTQESGGNGLILPSHMQSQPTREAMWQSEDPERLQTYMKVSAVPTYRTQLGENEETHVTFLLPQYNRTWAA